MAGMVMPTSDGLAEAPDGSLSKTEAWSISPSNIRIGDQFRVIRESHGISEKEFRVKLAIDFRDLTSCKSGKRRVRPACCFHCPDCLPNSSHGTRPFAPTSTPQLIVRVKPIASKLILVKSRKK